MGRWVPGTAGRLTLAALDLFAERGYDETTVADIAARAGLTERTFFRYYPAKRDVLFGGSDALNAAIADSMAAQPGNASPLELAFAGIAPLLADHADHKDRVRQRADAIASHPDLQERDLAKRSSLTDTLAEGLRARGVDDAAAEMLSHAVGHAYSTATRDWLESTTEASLDELIRARLDLLREALRD